MNPPCKLKFTLNHCCFWWMKLIFATPKLGVRFIAFDKSWKQTKIHPRTKQNHKNLRLKCDLRLWFRKIYCDGFSVWPKNAIDFIKCYFGIHVHKQADCSFTSFETVPHFNFNLAREIDQTKLGFHSISQHWTRPPFLQLSSHYPFINVVEQTRGESRNKR